jgi:hypothetical protein
MLIWLALAFLGCAARAELSPSVVDVSGDAARRRAESEISLALAAERGGKEPDRRRHLELALQASPNDELAQALLGKLFFDGRWLTVAQVIGRVREDDRWQQKITDYREQRRNVPPVSEAHVALARWCLEHGLRGEAHAHFTVAVRLDPENEKAWRWLGRQRHDTRWMTEGEILEETREAELQARADDYWVPTLKSLRENLRANRDADRTVAKLATIADPRAVPAIERAFSSGSEFDEEWLVWLLARIDSPESSCVLAQTLTKTRALKPRQAAIRVLSTRDPRAYLGLMINEMKPPTGYVTEPGPDGDPRYLILDRPEAIAVREYESSSVRDHGRYRPMYPSASTAVGPYAWVDNSRLANDVRRVTVENRRTILANDRIAESLRALTGKNFPPEPERWAAWWTDYLGYRYQWPQELAKPVIQESTASPVVPLASTRPGRHAGPPSRHSSFAAGTPVVTRTGFVPIEDLQIGDIVVSQDTRTGALGLQPVLTIQAFPPDRTLRLDFDDGPVFCTDIHRFWKPGTGWIVARDLGAGDVVRGVGRTSTLRAISPGPTQRVFNFEVAGTRAFHVGKSGLLVHDATLVPRQVSVFDDARRANPQKDQNN